MVHIVQSNRTLSTSPDKNRGNLQCLLLTIFSSFLVCNDTINYEATLVVFVEHSNAQHFTKQHFSTRLAISTKEV